MADPCAHPTFTSEVTVEAITPPNGLTPYHQACVRVWCPTCLAVLKPTGLPPLDAALFRTVALSVDGESVYLSGLVEAPA